MRFDRHPAATQLQPLYRQLGVNPWLPREVLTPYASRSRPTQRWGDAAPLRPLTPLSPAEDIHPMIRLEAALFLSREPVNTRKLAALADLTDATEARTLIAQLNQFYDQRGRSFQVQKVAGGYQLMTRPGFAKWIRRLEHVPNIPRLSSPALETLAVVAYRQPIVRAEIDAIRGVNSGEILRQLLERDLVRICGRSDDLGRPFLYATTRHFLKLFGLGSLEELPEAEKLRTPWILSDQTDSSSDDDDLSEDQDPSQDWESSDDSSVNP